MKFALNYSYNYFQININVFDLFDLNIKLQFQQLPNVGVEDTYKSFRKIMLKDHHTKNAKNNIEQFIYTSKRYFGWEEIFLKNLRTLNM